MRFQKNSRLIVKNRSRLLVLRILELSVSANENGDIYLENVAALVRKADEERAWEDQSKRFPFLGHAISDSGLISGRLPQLLSSILMDLLLTLGRGSGNQNLAILRKRVEDSLSSSPSHEYSSR